MGRFTATLEPGRHAGDQRVGRRHRHCPSPGPEVVRAARARARSLTASEADPVAAALVLAADTFIVGTDVGPDVVAGYPWFGAWSRDTMISYVGLFLATGRAEAGAGAAARVRGHAVGGHAREHARHRPGRAQHRRRDAVVPARGGPARRRDRRRRPRGRARRPPRRGDQAAHRRHPVRHPGRPARRPADPGGGRLRAHVDGCGGPRRAGHAAPGQGRRAERAVDQRARGAGRSARAGGARPRRPGRGAGTRHGVVRAALPGSRRLARTTSSTRPATRSPTILRCGRTSCWPTACRTPRCGEPIPGRCARSPVPS